MLVIKRIILFVFFLGCVIAGQQKGWAWEYPKIDFNADSFVADDIQLTAMEKQLLVEQLCQFARWKVKKGESLVNEDLRTIAKVLVIALKFDPKHRDAVVMNFQLKRGNLPKSTVENFDLEKTADRLYQYFKKIKEHEDQSNQLLSAYLLDLAYLMDPKNEKVMYELALVQYSQTEDPWALHLKSVQESKKADKVQEEETQTESSESKEEPVHDPSLELPRKENSIKSLLITEVNSGQEIGQTNDLIATVSKVSQGNEIKANFVRKVGESMKIALQESVRLMNKRFSDFDRRVEIELGFEDKYTPKDGGSAGTACSLLILSILEDYDLDSKFAVTGDITADGKVRKVGGIRAKIKGAIADECAIVAIPTENESDLEDMLILESAETLWDIQIFGVKTIDQALELAKQEKSKELQEALKLFREATQGLNVNSLTAVRRSREKVEALKKVRELAPNHLSSKYLIQKIWRRERKNLSLESSVNEVLKASAPFLPAVMNSKVRAGMNPSTITVHVMSQETYKSSLDRLNFLNFKLDQKVEPFHRAIYNFISTWQTYAEVEGKSQAREREYKRKLADRLEVAKSELLKLSYDKEFLEELIR